MKLADGKVTLHAGDCLEVLATLAENSIDAIVTDPPYELGFMGKSWDASGVAFCPDTWRLAWRVLKPGAHLVAFGAPKNYHRLACAIEDAGFEIRDSLMWVFGSGFPKSLDVSKAIDKAAGAEREIVGPKFRPDGKTMASAAPNGPGGNFTGDDRPWKHDPAAVLRNQSITAPATDAAREWQGWGTALKPAYEPIVLARKPLSEGTVAANVLRWGTGALNIDATRIETIDKIQASASEGTPFDCAYQKGTGRKYQQAGLGRWPANLCHDGSQGVLDLFPHTKSGTIDPSKHIHRNGKGNALSGSKDGSLNNYLPHQFHQGDEGSAARFFYCAKASKQDRAGSKHPTVKPINLMRWLVRMVTPPGGIVLDPFAGSGTTGLAAKLEGYDVQLIEREPEYQADIRSRFND